MFFLPSSFCSCWTRSTDGGGEGFSGSDLFAIGFTLVAVDTACCLNKDYIKAAVDSLF